MKYQRLFSAFPGPEFDTAIRARQELDTYSSNDLLWISLSLGSPLIMLYTLGTNEAESWPKATSSWLNQIVLPEDTPVMVYCAAGVRAQTAADMLLAEAGEGLVVAFVVFRDGLL